MARALGRIVLGLMRILVKGGVGFFYNGSTKVLGGFFKRGRQRSVERFWPSLVLFGSVGFRVYGFTDGGSGFGIGVYLKFHE